MTITRVEQEGGATRNRTFRGILALAVAALGACQSGTDRRVSDGFGAGGGPEGGDEDGDGGTVATVGRRCRAVAMTAGVRKEDAPAVRDFADSFVHGIWAPVCELDYAPFFDQAVSVIDTACEEFEPPG